MGLELVLVLVICSAEVGVVLVEVGVPPSFLVEEVGVEVGVGSVDPPLPHLALALVLLR